MIPEGRMIGDNQKQANSWVENHLGVIQVQGTQKIRRSGTGDTAKLMVGK